MKNIFAYKGYNVALIAVSLILPALGFNSCSEDDVIKPEIPSASEIQNHGLFLFRYDNNNDSYYLSDQITNTPGTELASGTSIGKWDCIAGLSVGVSQFVVLHSTVAGDDNKDFKIRRLVSGNVEEVTCSQTWHNSYNTFITFNVGDRGYVFGQDSDPYGRNWFTQEVYMNGAFASSEADKGDWNDYYEVATPLYVNDNTYIFFQTSSNDHYWFISHASADGKLNDVCDGYWGHLWKLSTSVTINGNTYLIGGHNEHDNYAGTEWFIQKINSDGTMGDETDRGGWNNYYYKFVAYTYDGKAYLFADDCTGTAGGSWFIQEITGDGKMGVEVSRGNYSREIKYACVMPYYDKPGSFRYSIGWDLSKTSGVPSRWSQRYDDPWGGAVKMGGGAALGLIDDGNLYDAVLMGIQDLPGPDRYYYKVAFNLDANGKAAAMTGTLFGPTVGEVQAGGGADIYDIDGNGIPDLVFMNVDDPQGANSFRYNIGWNLDNQGVPTVWGPMIQGPTIGDMDAGGGAAIGDLDKNGKPELVFMGIDNPEQENSFWLYFGKNMDKFGVVESWSGKITLPCNLGWLSSGGGLALADVNGNGLLDLVVMDVDSPKDVDGLWCYTGWDLDINGNVAGWSGKYLAPSTGNITAGAGTAIADIDRNGTLDVLMMAVDNPVGDDGAY